MSGHSKWASIKHKKGALDAKRGALFTKIIKELTIAAKHGGGNPESNPRLRSVLQKAKEANMPADNIERAIKKGTGELPGVVYEETNYEGYGPAGTAILIEAATDNKNRTTAEIRTIFEKRGGNMSGAGSVAWQFQKKGYLTIRKNVIEEDKLMSIALDAGAADFKAEKDIYEVITEPHDFEKVKKALADAKVPVESAEITRLPQSTVQVTNVAAARALLALMDSLEEHEDVQSVYSNFDISDELLQELE